MLSCVTCDCVSVRVCVCVYFQSTAGAEMKATGYETWSNKKSNYKASTGWGRPLNVSLKCSHSGQK